MIHFMYALNEDEKQKADDFIDSIYRPRTYSFKETSIGTKIIVTDDLTGKEKDITDYDSW